MLTDTLPEDVIDSSWIDSYKQTIDVLWWQLVRLNANIYNLEKILAFPFELFDPISPKHFWKLIENALFDSCVLIIWKVVVDNAFGEGITLQQFRNEIIQHIQRNEHREEFKKMLKDIDFEKTVSTFNSKIREIRHNYVAHLNLAKHISPTPEEIKLRSLLFDELKKYCGIINSFFNILCFGHQKALLPLEYNPDVIHPAGIDSRSDIEKLLDDVARNSDILNMPEKYPENWAMFVRNQLFSENLKILNEYRRKFALSAVK